MPVGQDPSPLFQQFAHPEKLVSADWVAEHLDDPSIVIVESDEDVLGRILGKRPEQEAAGSSGNAPGLESLNRSAVAPHIVETRDR